MGLLSEIKNDIAGKLSVLLPPEAAVSADALTRPPQAALGDLSFACFGAAKALKKSPAAVAQELVGKFQSGGFVAATEVAGPYLNFRLDRPKFSAALTRKITSGKAKWGGSKVSAREKVMVEYAQPNTHKEFHVGHLRNVCLGLAAVNLMRAVGFKVTPVSYMGDIGAHVAKCLWCLKKFHSGAPMPGNKGKYLGQIYAEATRRVDEEPALKDEVAEVQRKLEAREPEWDALWRETRQWSLDEFAAIFKELGVELDRNYYESEVEAPGKKLVKKLLKRGIAQAGEKGAIIVDLEKYGLGIFLVLKSDGNSLYSTKELALAELKFKEYRGVKRSIHVVDSRQSLYFKQFFKTLELMGFDKLKTTHLAYEFVTLKEGAMSSRAGNIVSYEDFRDEMRSRAAAETRERRTEWDTVRIMETARTVAEGAMKFGMLKQDPDKPIVFDIAAALSFDGFTGPYVQYAHARLCSILVKAEKRESGKEGKNEATGKNAIDVEAAEHAVLLKAAEFPGAVREAAASFKPSVLAQYLFDLASASNDFYRDVPVISADKVDRLRRLRIVEALKLTLANGLAVLGIKAPEEM
jgi:arginyl-tRNA synthetase